MTVRQLWVQRDALRTTKLMEGAAPVLEDGQVRFAIDKFALTANNITYALTGDTFGYWKFYPAEGQWGQVPVWGFADAVESRCAEILVGERIWGFLPMASEVVLRPGRVDAARFTDFTPHRRELPAVYNQYARTAGEPPFLKTLEDARCLTFPLFATSYILYDYLVSQDFFGAGQVLIGSASSKTGFGLAHLLHRDAAVKQPVIGLTSPGNRAFVESLGVCDRVVAYPDIASLDATKPVAFVDMAGSGPLIAAVHRHFGEGVKESCIVGATHWEEPRHRGELPGARPTVFFAPAHIARRDKEQGAGSTMQRATVACAQIAQAVAGRIEVMQLRGPAAVEREYLAMIDNRVPPSRGLMLSMRD